jgi:hypothetical protein
MEFQQGPRSAAAHLAGRAFDAFERHRRVTEAAAVLAALSMAPKFAGCPRLTRCSGTPFQTGLCAPHQHEVHYTRRLPHEASVPAMLVPATRLRAIETSAGCAGIPVLVAPPFRMMSPR